MSKEDRIIKRFIAGGQEYRISEAENGGYDLEVWKETNYDDGYWDILYHEDDFEDMYRRQEEVYELGAEYDLNL